MVSFGGLLARQTTKHYPHEKLRHLFRLAATIGGCICAGQNPDGYFGFVEAAIRLEAMLHLRKKPG